MSNIADLLEVTDEDIKFWEDFNKEVQRAQQLYFEAVILPEIMQKIIVTLLKDKHNE